MYLKVGQVATESVKPRGIVGVSIPETTGLFWTLTRLSQTYSANQNQNGYRLVCPVVEVFTGLGNSKDVAVQIAPLLLSAMKSRLEEGLQQTRIQRESLNAGNMSITGATAPGTRAGRAKPFLEYAVQHGASLYGVHVKVGNREDLSSTDIDAVTRAAYDAMRRESKATSRIKEGIRGYIRSGEIDPDVLNFLARVIPAAFGRPAEYQALTGQLEEMAAQLRQVEQVQQTFDQAFDSRKSGNGKRGSPALEDLVRVVSEIKGGAEGSGVALLEGLQINVAREIQGLLGPRYGTVFLSRIDEVVSKWAGAAGKGVLSPVYFKVSSGANIPEDLNRIGTFVPTSDFVAYVQVLDGTLTDVLLAYLHAGEAEHKGLAVHVGLLMRRMMPDNPAIQIIYPDDTVTIPGQPALAAEIAARAGERFRNGEMARLAAKHMGLTEKELNPEGLERLVSLQNSVMPLLPLEVYHFAASSQRMRELETEFKTAKDRLRTLQLLQTNPLYIKNQEKLVTNLAYQYELSAQKWRELMQTLLNEFGTSMAAVPDYKTKIEETIGLFGEEKAGFIRHVLKEELQQHEQHEQQPSAV